MEETDKSMMVAASWWNPAASAARFLKILELDFFF